MSNRSLRRRIGLCEPPRTLACLLIVHVVACAGSDSGAPSATRPDESRDSGGAGEGDGGIRMDAAAPDEVEPGMSETREEVRDGGIVLVHPDGAISAVLWPDGMLITDPVPCTSDRDCPAVKCLPEIGYCDIPGEVPAPTPAGTPSDEALACDEDLDCRLVPRSAEHCCAPCDLTAGDVLAVNAGAAARLFVEVCGEPSCTPCNADDGLEVRAACRSSRCTVLPLSGGEATRCMQHSDCSVRAKQCCECGASTGPGDLVAISDHVTFRRFACSGNEECDDCAVTYPPEVLALCDNYACTLADPRPF